MTTRNGNAPTPPMGWNSWDCYGTTLTETELRANAQYMAQHLLPFGWDTIVVDAAWFDPNPRRHGYNQDRFIMDEYGRLWPDPARFPSAANGQGFKPLADELHALGLKFGVHLMRGIPRQAVDENARILGTAAHAGDIADPENACRWNQDNYGVKMDHPAGQAYYDSVLALAAEWGLDYLKVDDMISPYHIAEVEAVSQAIARCGRPIVLSLSPGMGVSPKQARHLKAHADLWRVSGDFWDGWERLKPDFTGLRDQFAILAEWARHAGPGHWPDADMLPVGRLGPRPPEGEDRPSNLSHDEQLTMLTLWMIARSPLMLGCDLPSLDTYTLRLLTNPTALRMHRSGQNPRQLFFADNQAAWAAEDGSGGWYLALFNLDDHEAQAICVDLGAHLGLDRPVRMREVWTGGQVNSTSRQFTAYIFPHAAELYHIQPM